MHCLRRLLLSITFVSLSSGFAQSQVAHRGDCVVDPEVFLLPKCALETRDGHLYIFQEFLPLLFSSRKGNFDNGPSPFHHGLVRVNRAGKWGLADSKGLLVVPLIYDGMLEYDEPNRGWTACRGCRSVSDGEHSWFEGGDWYRLDRRGTVAGKAENPMKPGGAGIK